MDPGRSKNVSHRSQHQVVDAMTVSKPMRRSYGSKACELTGRYSCPVALHTRVLTNNKTPNRQAKKKSPGSRRCTHTIALRARLSSNPLCPLGRPICNTSRLMVKTALANFKYPVAKSVLRILIALTMPSVPNIAQTAMESAEAICRQ